jgi:1-deoxy-D-xylulose-5-phosphate reductoisomerase
MVRSIAILGSTGSIGRQTVDVAQRLGIKVRALTAEKNIDLLEQQARQLSPAYVAVYNEAAARELRHRLSDTGIAVGSGERGLIEAAVIRDTQAVVTAVSGAVGLKPTLAAIEKGKRIALANKETLVCAGTLVMRKAKQYGAEIVPVDSEHSAIFQCLAAASDSGKERRKILLTGSGGPFRGKTRAETASVTREQALAHPTWNMGAKISIDSATMMNKGLEFIEAMHLFACSPDDIEIVIHPQSIVHSMVEMTDGSVIAQLGPHDMRLPIQYALTYPERGGALTEPLDFPKLGSLTFFAPDYDQLPCLRMALEAARTGGTAPAILSAANEVAVHMFLDGRIGYNEISDCVESALSGIEIISEPCLDEILQADSRARELVLARGN